MTPPPLMNDPEAAWAAYEPTTAEPWDLARVAHLHRRAGFAAPWATLERDLRDGPEPAVERLLRGEDAAADGTPAVAFDRLMEDMDRRMAASGDLGRLQAAWLYRMIGAAHPLRERMTLFWHDHFATSNAKVNNLALMQAQNDLLRRHALGDFRALLGAIGKDPAMLIYLDATSNRKGHPNENYAREVMELFTLGRGHYSEADIQEAARAFTGRHVRGDRFAEVAADHDDGVKTVLGLTGRLRGEDVESRLLEQPACAEFLCGKLFRHLVSEVDEPTAELIAPLAEGFRASGYDVAVPVRTILLSRLLHAEGLRRRRVKGPVEHVVGTIRALEVLKPTVSLDALADVCTRMGQSLFAPPNVSGWDGGPAWIHSAALLERTNFALGLLADGGPLGGRLDPAALARKHGTETGEAAAGFFADLLVQDGLSPAARRRIVAEAVSADTPAAAARQAATLILTAPGFQLA